MTVPQVRRESRPPWAAAALAGIVAITAGWWALALWPLGSTAPEWITRTREVCFGATRDSLPHAGGWILLFGEPIGMYAVLRIAFGAGVRLEDYHTRWVVVTFAFGHCDDICPVIVQHAREARRETGREDVPLLVVTLDPWRDTPDRLAHIAAQWELAPADHVLGGNVADVTAVLDAWGIPRVRDLTTGDIAHGSTLVLIDPEGRLAWRLDGAPQRIREALALAR